MILGIQICSNLEWKSVKRHLGIEPARLQRQPFGERFQYSVNSHKGIFYQSGDSKTKAAAACQYVIDRWQPDAIVNLGTCGGVSSKIRQFEVILANRTVHYDCDIHFGPKPKVFIGQ